MATETQTQERGRVEKEQLTVVLPAEMARRLRRIARETGMPISMIIALALRPVVGSDVSIPRYARFKTLKEDKNVEGGGRA